MKPRHFLIYLIIFIFFIHSITTRQITLKNRKLYDNQNRQITLHGTNIVVKVPPYIPTYSSYDNEYSFGPDDIQNLKQNGFNSIRLGVMWAGVEPQKDAYNQTYLEEMVNIVNKAGEAGIYTLVEYHQDLFSEVFCGDGVPIWLVKELNINRTFPFPVSGKDKYPCASPNWSKYYFSYDVGQGFRHLYNPNHILNHKFMSYWQKVASTFKNNPYVIAYQLINEPWIGNIWRDPLLIVPSMAQRLKLQQFYDLLSIKIRQIDPFTPLCFQPVTFDNTIPTGFSHPPGGKKYQNESIFCYHHYQPPALNISQMNTYVKDAKKLGIGSILSETYGNEDTLKRAEELKQSWMYWIYKGFGNKYYHRKANNQNNSFIENAKLDKILRDKLLDGLKMDDHLIRTYLQRVAGQLDSSVFNPKTAHFMGKYWATSGGQTVFYMNKQRIYNNSYIIEVFPSKQVQIKQDGNFITLKYIGQQQNKKILVTVTKL